MTHPLMINGRQYTTRMMTHHQIINGLQDAAAALYIFFSVCTMRNTFNSILKLAQFCSKIQEFNTFYIFFSCD